MLTLTLHANGVAPTPDPYLVTRFDPGHGDQGSELEACTGDPE